MILEQAAKATNITIFEKKKTKQPLFSSIRLQWFELTF